MSKPKLELQINIPQKIKLLQTEPATGTNSYGNWYLYNVMCEGTEYSYFAPEKIVSIFKEKNLSEGDEVLITKKLVKKGNKNITDYELNVFEERKSESSGVIKDGSATNSVGTVNGNHNAGKSENTTVKENLSKDYPDMLQSMKEAFAIRDEIGSDVDVNKIGITLFLRKGKL